MAIFSTGMTGWPLRSDRSFSVVLGIRRLSSVDQVDRLAEGGFSVHETRRVAMSRVVFETRREWTALGSALIRLS
ncbi:hypothetical protein [Mesorhizobium sp. LSJC280B00]|uniref:hypothetical protein n=1 Tax=Mesorhizobium sp. LSJC280B00 TaxID=1287336 RepID=UPI0018DDFEF0|nr:hypothetical protein [Mesorhizobium sp. LSJC280B00]